MSAITAKASRKMKKYAVLTREPRCFLGSFDFSWEQRKFEEIAVRSSVICSDDTLPRVEYEDIVSGTGRLNKDIYAKQSIKSGIAFHQGDVLYGKLRPYLQNWLLPTFDGLAVGDFWVLQPQNADSSFLYRLIQSRQFDEVANQSTGTKMPRADWKLVSKTVFSIPSNISEQAAIGTYFTALDSLITLHQRKCVFLFGFFQAFISMIFTASTFSWEQRKVGDLLIERNQQAPMSDEYPLMAFIANEGVAPKGERYDRSALVTDTVNKLYKKTEKGDFIYSSNNLETGSIGLNKYGKACISPVYSIFEPTGIADSDFLGRRLVRKDFINAMVKWRQGVIYGQWRIHESDFLKIEITVPSVEEQRKIGAYLDQLDNLITLHQRECISFTARAGRRILTANKKRNTSSWEQRKFSDVVATRRGLTYKPSDIRKNGVRVLRSSNIAEDSFVLSDEDVFVVREAVNIDCVRANDILITAANGSSRLVGKHTIISGIPEESAVHGGFMLLGTTKEPHFVNASMGSSWYRRFIELFVAGGNGAIGNLNKNDLDNQDIAIPSEKEQKKIGSFFRQLDNLITLHQRKFEKLTNVKKSMLEKMFPQNGSSYPEIRFKGFTDPWEQRKLGDIADIVGGGTPSTGNQSYWDGDIDWYAPAEIADQIYANSSQKKITGLGYENSSAKMLPPGTVLFTSRAGIGKTAILTRKGCTNQGFQSIVPHRGELDSYFIFSRTEELKRYGELVGAGSTFVEVSGKQMAVMELMMPPTMREQQTIGGFFQQLDHLITLHQRELEKLQNIKKSMLEKMFV